MNDDGLERLLIADLFLPSMFHVGLHNFTSGMSWEVFSSLYIV